MSITDDELSGALRAITATVSMHADVIDQAKSLARRKRRRQQSAAVLSCAVVVGAIISITIATPWESPPSRSALRAGASSPGELGWSPRGDLAGNSAATASAVQASESQSVNGAQVASDPHILYLSTVPGNLDLAVVEGIDSTGQPVVMVLQGKSPTSLTATAGQAFAKDLSSTPLSASISYAWTPSNTHGFVVVIGQPGTANVSLSIAPTQQGATFGPDFHPLPMQDGVGIEAVPAGSDAQSIFFSIQGPNAPSDYLYPYFSSP